MKNVFPENIQENKIIDEENKRVFEHNKNLENVDYFLSKYGFILGIILGFILGFILI